MAILGNISDKNYSELKGLRNSNFSLLEKSWKHFKEIKVEETDALIFGRAFHTLILEENKFWEQFAVAPEKLDRRTKEGKEIWATLQASGKTILAHDDLKTLESMKAALVNHPLASKILHRSENEGAYTAEINGVECKCKADLINQGYIFDLKTCLDASPEGFKKSIGQRKYHRQGAFYSDILERNGIEMKGFIFVAIEKVAPFNIGVYMLEQDSMDIGRKDYLRLVEKYKYHSENVGAFEGYSPNIEPISAPNWIFMDEAVI
jgi:exodeoxyribonuclease VIII